MKSDARKSTARKNVSAPSDDIVKTINVEVTDADYAEQLLKAAEALTPQPTAAAEDSGEKKQASATAMNKSTAHEKLDAKSDEIAAGNVVLPTQCLMRDAIELKTQLLQQIDTDDTVQIDVSKLERIDAAAMQLLLAFVLQRTKNQRKVKWLGVNAVMAEAATLLGLASLLQLPDLREAA